MSAGIYVLLYIIGIVVVCSLIIMFFLGAKTGWAGLTPEEIAHNQSIYRKRKKVKELQKRLAKEKKRKAKAEKKAKEMEAKKGKKGGGGGGGDDENK